MPPRKRARSLTGMSIGVRMDEWDQILNGLVCGYCAGTNMVAVEVRGLYDGALFWKCSDCGGTQHRWPLTDVVMHAKADPYIHGPTKRLDD